MVWEAHKPHDSTFETFFGYCKNDGFVKRKKLGRIDYLKILRFMTTRDAQC
jgi:hypothetical protein